MSIESTLTKRFIADIKSRLAAAASKGHGSIKLELPDADILIGLAEERLQAILDAEQDAATDRNVLLADRALHGGQNLCGTPQGVEVKP